MKLYLSDFPDSTDSTDFALLTPRPLHKPVTLSLSLPALSSPFSVRTSPFRVSTCFSPVFSDIRPPHSFWNGSIYARRLLSSMIPMIPMIPGSPTTAARLGASFRRKTMTSDPSKMSCFSCSSACITEFRTMSVLNPTLDP
ncbi:Protein of unknown function [Pyronema omphalodes CBS 100304]|uniref:Uncharacterized protein n=1 Tax=Pyronema omphalodes (strain CBS 100304) TaxID=1076935 RepID=U4LFM7_PYROM|nr:Protein of unknown function [Pyronema omphalodes CBS 100304]